MENSESQFLQLHFNLQATINQLIPNTISFKIKKYFNWVYQTHTTHPKGSKGCKRLNLKRARLGRGLVKDLRLGHMTQLRNGSGATRWRGTRAAGEGSTAMGDEASSKAWRRSVAGERRASLVALFNGGAATKNGAGGMRMNDCGGTGSTLAA